MSDKQEEDVVARRKAQEHDAKYPEHVKLRSISGQSQAIGAFLDWLLNAHEPELFLCIREKHHGRGSMTYGHAVYSIEKLLAEYFEIDSQKISDEKDAMVRALQQEAEKIAEDHGIDLGVKLPP